METPERGLIPRINFVELQLQLLMKSFSKPDLTTMEALGRITIPRVDRGEVVELYHAPAGRGGISPDDSRSQVDFVAVNDVTENHPLPGKLTRHDPSAQNAQPGRIINLIAIDGKNPRVFTHIGLEQSM